MAAALGLMSPCPLRVIAIPATAAAPCCQTLRYVPPRDFLWWILAWG